MMLLMAGLDRVFRIQEFADLAGVTVKALHHYDRLELLRPSRTASGYRVYRESDLTVLEQIIALQFLGLPLKQIREVLARTERLPEALRVQRLALEEKRDWISRTIAAIRKAESALAEGHEADAELLKPIIEVIDMQDGLAVMKKYYSDEAWERRKRYYEEGPSEEWQALYREGQALLGSDPGSDEAAALVARWFDLSRRAWMGEEAVQTDSPMAWLDRDNWPPVMKQRMAEFQMEEVWGFVRKASIASNKRYFSDAAWARILHLAGDGSDHTRRWQERVDLFRDVENALNEDPLGPVGQQLAQRWLTHLDEVSGHNAEVKEGLLRGWDGRRYWPAHLRWMVEGLHGMTFERMEACAEFLDRASPKEPAAEIEEAEFNEDPTDVATWLVEFDREMSLSRWVLEQIPDGQFALPVQALANGIAAVPLGMKAVLGSVGSPPETLANRVELLEAFDRRVAAAREALAATSDDALSVRVLVQPGVRKSRSAALGWMFGRIAEQRRVLATALQGS